MANTLTPQVTTSHVSFPKWIELIRDDNLARTASEYSDYLGVLGSQDLCKTKTYL